MPHALFNAPAPTNEPIQAYGPGSVEKRELKSELARQRQTPIEIPLVIDGKHIMTKNGRSVTSPHNKSLTLARCAQASAEDTQAAVTAALHARKSWSVMPWAERAAVFLKAADLLATKYRAKMNAATMLGQSKTCYQSEIDAACELIDFFRWNVHFMTEIYAQQPVSPVWAARA